MKTVTRFRVILTIVNSCLADKRQNRSKKHVKKKIFL